MVIAMMKLVSRAYKRMLKAAGGGGKKKMRISIISVAETWCLPMKVVQKLTALAHKPRDFIYSIILQTQNFAGLFAFTLKNCEN